MLKNKLEKMARQAVLTVALASVMMAPTGYKPSKPRRDDDDDVQMPGPNGYPIHVPKKLYDLGVTEDMDPKVAEKMVSIYWSKENILSERRVQASDVPPNVAWDAQAGHYGHATKYADGSVTTWHRGNVWDTVENSRGVFAGSINETVGKLTFKEYEGLTPGLQDLVNGAIRLAKGTDGAGIPTLDLSHYATCGDQILDLGQYRPNTDKV